MDLFLQACGARGPLQLRIEGPAGAGSECLSFDTPYVVIGRDPRSDLVLDHGDICGRHAYLQGIGGRLYCVDLGSRGGIALGGQNRRAGWVEPGRALRIGLYRIRVEGTMKSCASGAQVLDISQTGLQVLSAAVPPVGTRLWLRLESPQITDWVEVVLKGATADAPGAYRVRLAFRELAPTTCSRSPSTGDRVPDPGAFGPSRGDHEATRSGSAPPNPWQPDGPCRDDLESASRRPIPGRGRFPIAVRWRGGRSKGTGSTRPEPAAIGDPNDLRTGTTTCSDVGSRSSRPSA